jgi:hypothetical protein
MLSKPLPCYVGLLGGIAVAPLLATSVIPAAQAFTITSSQTSNPFAGITYQQLTGNLGANRPLSLHATLVDLSAPGISFGVTAPNANGTTNTERTLAYANRVGAQVSINANFFNRAFNPTTVEGLAAANGTVYGSPLVNFQGTINLAANNQASLLTAGQSGTLFNAVTGNMVLINGGQIVNQSAFDSTGLFARTAMGVTNDNRLLLFVVDGPAARVNNTVISSGLTQVELANILLNQFNTRYAVNLDGGGSTGMVLCQPTCAYVNQPSAISNTPFGPIAIQGDRPVGNNFAVFAQSNAEPVLRPHCRCRPRFWRGSSVANASFSASSVAVAVPVPPQVLGTLLSAGLVLARQKWAQRAVARVLR